MSIFTSRPALRWGAPVLVGAVVLGGGAAVRGIAAAADPALPARTAAQLLVDLQTARLDGGSGTVAQRADLGLPSLPGIGGQGSSDINALVTGSHTLRVWYAGPDKARVALLGTLGESDIITNGTDLWVWNSQKNEATHSIISKSDGAPRGLEPNAMPKTPQEAADAALAAIDPSTEVSTSGAAKVAGRSAYELTLKPKDRSSLVGSIQLAIDADKHVPLRVRVYPANSDKIAFEVAFTQVSFNRPDDAQFRFNPPKNAKVTEGDKAEPQSKSPDTGRAPAAPDQQRSAPKTIGQGWTSVLVAHAPAEATATKNQQPNGFSLDMLPRVSGSWGSGHLLTSRLFSVLLTDDGRVLGGAVSPDRLYQVAADPAAK
jgi:outer membrane lipoprotein-sorting protein